MIYKKIVADGEDIERFWSKVAKKSEDECWEWLAGKNVGGYGQIKIKNKMYIAHRISWFLCNGEIPEGLRVCHTCDNPGCVNPTHLFLGTDKDNMRDKKEKGRNASRAGENNGQHKLTEAQVIEIREKYIPYKYTLIMIAEEYGMSKSAIQYIIEYKSWKHVV